MFLILSFIMISSMKKSHELHVQAKLLLKGKCNTTSVLLGWHHIPHQYSVLYLKLFWKLWAKNEKLQEKLLWRSWSSEQTKSPAQKVMANNNNPDISWHFGWCTLNPKKPPAFFHKAWFVPSHWDLNKLVIFLGLLWYLQGSELQIL